MNDTYLVAILPNIITSVLALIVWQVKRSISKREAEEQKRLEAEAEEKAKAEAEQQERDAKMQTVISSLAFTTQQLEVVREEYRCVKKANAQYDKQINDIVESMQVLKKNALATTKKMLTDIFQIAREQGFVSAHIKEVAAELMAVYLELGGNSYIHAEYEAFLRLPTKN